MTNGELHRNLFHLNPALRRRRIKEINVQRLILSFVFTLFAWPSLADTGLDFPSITHADLNERMVTLPAELPGNPSIVFIAYRQNQQPDVNTWLSGLALTASDPIYEFIELPVVGSGAKMIRSTIDNGMRSGIVDPNFRARTITVYSSRKAFNAALDIQDRSQIYTLVVTRDGSVLAKVAGPFDESKAKIIKEAFK